VLVGHVLVALGGMQGKGGEAKVQGRVLHSGGGCFYHWFRGQLVCRDNCSRPGSLTKFRGCSCWDRGYTRAGNCVRRLRVCRRDSSHSSNGRRGGGSGHISVLCDGGGGVSIASVICPSASGRTN